MMAAEIDTTKAGFIAAKPRLLFSGYVEVPPGMPQYDVSPDGQRFLMIKTMAAPDVKQITVVTNALGSGANLRVAGDDEEMQRFVPIEDLFKGRHFDRQIIFCA
jgi:hypothetical protein